MDLKKVCSSVVITLCAISVVSASFAIQPATVHPSRPDTCYVKESKSIYENGDSWRISGCGLATCMKIGSKMMISYESCGSVGAEPSCTIKEDKEAEFPDCCPEVVCDSSEQQSDFDANNNNNEVSKNETAKAEPEQLADYYYYDQQVPNYYEELEGRTRTWRHAEDEKALQLLDNSIDTDSFEDDEMVGKKDYELFTKNKFSPKFFYWA